MPVTQAVLLYEVHNFDRLFDEMVKWYGMPYPHMRKGMKAAEQQLKQAKAEFKAGTWLATLLLPAMQKVASVSYRIDCKLAGLVCVEAIRQHAAAHGGKLPATLKDITIVPVPVNPYSGEPFEYLVKGNTATLTAPPVEGDIPQSSSWTIAITMNP
jgi:hypothetical protein